MKNAEDLHIWITGGDGQLGQCLRDAVAAENTSAVFTERNDLDLADTEKVEAFLKEHKPNVLINTAAYTAVDQAEDEPEEAAWVNEKIPAVLANACADNKVLLIHLSTDYVFDGTATVPYAEIDAVNPKSVYGKTKRVGEETVLGANPNNMVVRTAWLFSEYGHNFMKTMIKLGAVKPQLRVVNDQHGKPTYAGHLAKTLLAMAVQSVDKAANHGGIYHFANAGETTWYAFASEIMKQKGYSCEVQPCTTEEFPTKAARPAYSVLNTQKIQRTFGVEIIHWKKALSEAIQKLPKHEM